MKVGEIWHDKEYDVDVEIIGISHDDKYSDEWIIVTYLQYACGGIPEGETIYIIRKEFIRKYYKVR